MSWNTINELARRLSEAGLLDSPEFKKEIELRGRECVRGLIKKRPSARRMEAELEGVSYTEAFLLAGELGSKPDPGKWLRSRLYRELKNYLWADEVQWCSVSLSTAKRYHKAKTKLPRLEH